MISSTSYYKTDFATKSKSLVKRKTNPANKKLATLGHTLAHLAPHTTPFLHPTPSPHPTPSTHQALTSYQALSHTKPSPHTTPSPYTTPAPHTTPSLITTPSPPLTPRPPLIPSPLTHQALPSPHTPPSPQSHLCVSGVVWVRRFGNGYSVSRGAAGV